MWACIRDIIQSISTHSLTRRLTLSSRERTGKQNYFNSQSHKEADGVNDLYFQGTGISTHSLTRRLTAM